MDKTVEPQKTVHLEGPIIDKIKRLSLAVGPCNLEPPTTCYLVNTAIYSCLSSKSNRSNKINQATKDVQSVVNWGKKWLVSMPPK